MSRARDLASNVTALDALADSQAMLTARGVGEADLQAVAA